jgi:hypothetical protein
VSASADPLLSALVVLAPAAERDADAPVHAGNLADALPDAAGAERARAHFGAEGFEVSEVVATAFSITGPRSLFQRCLGPSAAPDAALRGAHEDLALPLERLPRAVASVVREITFTPPPDFGPGNP